MQNKKPLISVITPVYNREKFIVECIQSVQNQTYTNYEHIIIDDGSLDKTVEVVENFASNDSKIIFIKNPKNSGGKPGLVRNIGLKQAKGEFIAFLDSDDLWEINKLEKQLDFMLQSDFDISYHPLVKFRTSLADQDGFWGRECSFQDYFRGLFLSNFISTCSVMAKKSVLKEVDFFDESLQYSEDHFLWMKLAVKNFSFGFMPLVLGGFRRDKHGNINEKLDQLEKIYNNIYLKEKIIFEYRSDSVSKLLKTDLFYGFIVYYFQAMQNAPTNKIKKDLYEKAFINMKELNLLGVFLKEIDLMVNLRKKII